jgi:origin recognition complex subunit 6
MADLCFDVFGIAKEKKDPKSIKGNRGTYILIHNSFVMSLSYSYTYVKLHATKHVGFLGVMHIFCISELLNKLQLFVPVTGLLDVLPSKRKHEDDSDSSDDESSEDDQDELDVCT